jgi:hypothetical protein
VLLLAVPALALGLGGAVALAPSLFFYVLTFDIWVLAYPHITSTYTRIAFDRASARRHWFLLTVLPVLTLAGTAGIGALGGAGGLFTAYYIGQTYHYTRQSYGIARAYRRRAVAPDRASGWLADAVIHAFPIWGLLHRASQGHEVFYENPLHLPTIPQKVAAAAGVVACGLWVAWGYRELRGLAAGNQRRGHVIFVLSHVVITVVGYLALPDITVGWLVINLWHNAQYLVFVWGFNRMRFRDAHDPESPWLSRLCLPRNLWAYGLVCVGIGAGLHAAVGELGRRLAAGVFPAALVLHLTINFHHYLVDGVIWKRRAPGFPAE